MDCWPPELLPGPRGEASLLAPPCVILKCSLWERGEGEILKVEYYFGNISSFFLIPPSAPQKAFNVIFLYGCLPNTLRPKPHILSLYGCSALLSMLCVILSLVRGHAQWLMCEILFIFRNIQDSVGQSRHSAITR